MYHFQSYLSETPPSSSQTIHPVLPLYNFYKSKISVPVILRRAHFLTFYAEICLLIIVFFLVFCLFCELFWYFEICCYLRLVTCVQPSLALKLVSSCLSYLNTEIIGMCHNARYFLFLCAWCFLLHILLNLKIRFVGLVLCNIFGLNFKESQKSILIMMLASNCTYMSICSLNSW